jgi:heme/copper-type cytochrome/quinol oxidase subunit 2
MISQNVALYNWNNGVIMMVIFGLVCLTLIGFLVKFMTINDRDKDEPKEK